MPLRKFRICTVITYKTMIQDAYNRPLKRPYYFIICLLLCFSGLLSACSDWANSDSANELKVELWYEQHALSCQALQRDEQIWAIQQLAFFLSDWRIVQDDKVQHVSLLSNSWQQPELALIALALPACQTGQTPLDEAPPAYATLNNRISFSEGLNQATELRFQLGLPFELNHANPLEQTSPLNMPDMFWSWRGGHKFLRLDMAGQPQSWSFHLGSTGCVADSAMRAPQISCVNPNAVNIRLAKQQDGERLLVHLDRLLAGVTLNNKSLCLMQAEQASCQILMNNLQHNQVFEWR